MTWVNTFPKLASKNDLRGKPLNILADRPPEPSTKKGMYTLLVCEVDTDNKFNVLITAQDVQKIIDVVTDKRMENPRYFTFDQTQPWAEVVAYAPVPDTSVPDVK